jgi:serine/threonine protein kinase/predicted esterase
MSDPILDDEELLARCLERLPSLGLGAIEEVCGEDIERRARLRARLAALERLGLVSERDPGTAPAAIGPYRVVEFLGQGGMGEVYLGVDDKTGGDQAGGDRAGGNRAGGLSGRKVAIKIGHVPLSALVSGASAQRSRARFEREIRAVAELEHEGIVAIHDVGESHGRPYFAMEFVEGATLARIIDELRERHLGFDQLSARVLRDIVDAVSRHDGDRPDHPVEGAIWRTTYVETVCRWVVEIAEALAHAHSHSIVHRDVKPANVMIARDGRAKLFDLGLASMADQPALTRTGDLAGSPFYMSPEQITGPPKRIDHRTDVYSLGVTLYELLTLRRPFEGPTSAQVFRQIVNREPPLLRKLNPLVPRDLETICLTALEKDPDRRYPSMDEFAADVKRLLALQPVRAKPAGTARRTWRFARRNPALSTALILGGLVLVGLPIGLLWANSAIRTEERRAAREAYLKSKVTEFLVDQFELTDAERESEREKGATISARELLDRGVEGLEGAFEDDPLVRAELYAATGTVYRNLGLHERAIPLLDRALAIRQSSSENDPRALASLLNELAGAHLSAGHPETAARLCERGLALLAGSPGPPGLDVAKLRRTLAEAAGLLGDHAEVARSLDAALDALRGVEARGADTADVLERLGVVAMERGDPASARTRLAEALAIRKEAWSPDVVAIARVLEALAHADEALGEREKAHAERGEAARYGVAWSKVTRVDRLPFVVGRETKPDYEKSFQSGITALQSRELDRAIAAFARCLEIDPSRPVPAYNIACGYALSGDLERGIEWLARAADMGFDVAEYRLRVAESDPEIASLRSDPRGAAILDRMRLHAERVRAFARSPAIVLSKAARRGEPGALLVVLHAEGRTPSDVLAGPWAALAEALDAALLAPCGSIPTLFEPEQGMTWFEDPGDLEKKPLEVERDVEDAVRTFLSRHEVDRGRIWIGGEGLGAMVAFDVALRAPGLYKGALLVGGPIHPDTPPDRARRAASLGLRTAYVVGPGVPGCPLDSAELGERVGRWLSQCGFVDARIVRPREGESTDRVSPLRSVLESWGE